MSDFYIYDGYKPVSLDINDSVYRYFWLRNLTTLKKEPFFVLVRKERDNSFTIAIREEIKFITLIKDGVWNKNIYLARCSYDLAVVIDKKDSISIDFIESNDIELYSGEFLNRCLNLCDALWLDGLSEIPFYEKGCNLNIGHFNIHINVNTAKSGARDTTILVEFTDLASESRFLAIQDLKSTGEKRINDFLLITTGWSFGAYLVDLYYSETLEGYLINFASSWYFIDLDGNISLVKHYENNKLAEDIENMLDKSTDLFSISKLVTFNKVFMGL